MNTTTKLLLYCCFVMLLSHSANAIPINLAFDGATRESMTLIALSQSGATKSVVVSKGQKSARISVDRHTSQLFLRRANGSLIAIASESCNSSGTQCSTKNILPYFKKGSFKLTGISALSTSQIGDRAISIGRVLLATASRASQYNQNVNTKVVLKKASLEKNLASNGQKSSSASSSRAGIGIQALLFDQDLDGLPDAVDIDNDGDGILDNYDTDSSDKPTGSAGKSFYVFSNFKTDIATSINAHTTGLTTSAIDTLMQSVQTLAIQVRGTTSSTAELDCGALGYCSAGGTGTTVDGSEAFPGTAGGSHDADGDGRGEMTRGSTGDFQLDTGATTATINAGDTLIQYVTTSSGTVHSSLGRLNFVFVSNPALKSVQVNGNSAQTINYSTTPIIGSNNNCISAPASGAVSLTITGWRPQRFGNSSAGEASYVDLGNSGITIDVPNAPCSSPMGGCSGIGPGNCIASAYTTSDSNLTSSPNGLQDIKGDIDADSTNTYSFTIDLTSCLNNASSGPVSWSSGQTLYVDLQFRSNYGDNAAQKFCIQRS